MQANDLPDSLSAEEKALSDYTAEHPGKESEDGLRGQLLRCAGEIVRAEPYSTEQQRLRARAEELMGGGGDLVAARRLATRPDPGLRAAFAAQEAALETPANASVLYALIDAFVCMGAAMTGDGPLLRLERWLDTPYGPLTAQRCSLEDAESALDRDHGEARGEVEARGYLDASDPSLPMAALWLSLDAAHQYRPAE
jgi:hypothetical protein